MGNLTADDLAVFQVVIFDDAGLPTVTQTVTACYSKEGGDPSMPSYTAFKDQRHKTIKWVPTGRVASIDLVKPPASGLAAAGGAQP